MKTTAPWLVAILLLALSPLDAFGRITNQQADRNSRDSRSPVTNSRVNRNAQQPTTQRPAQRPAQLPAQRPAQRPAQLPAQRPAQRPAQLPAQRPNQQPPAQRPNNQRPPAQRPVQNPPAQRPVTRPAERPGNRPITLPENRPNVRPDNRPNARPEARPENLPNIRPENRPENRPNNRPEIRPENRPSNRPETRPNTRPPERPVTLPGNVTFPRPNDRPNVSRPNPSRPGTGINRPEASRPDGGINRPEGLRPGGGITRPDSSRPDASRPGISRPGGNTNRPDISRPGGGLQRPGGNTRPDFDIRNRPETRPGNRPDWNNNWGNWGDWDRNGNRPIVVTRPNNRPNFNNNNININTNIRNSPNWSYRPNYWGSRPWWNTRHHHHWHHGSWCYGWGRSSRSRSSWSNGFFWGVTAWTMGNTIFHSGYQSFRNPFPAPPVINHAGTTIINYTSPITVAAAEFPPGDEASEQAAAKKSEAAMEDALAAFKNGNYPAALTAIDTAISAVPGDAAMHEFRALVFFSMGRFNDAAGVLNPILASGPGWDWTTMTGLFDTQDTYTNHLRKLEEHQLANPDSAAANFLLGYHYLVLGHLEQALELFEHSAKLEPTDIVSAGLRDLIRDSITNEDDDAETTGDTPPPTPVHPDKLVGTWVSTVANDGTITLVLTENGDFTWSFDKTAKSGTLTGEFGIYDSNLLVLMSEDSQMVGEVSFEDDSKLSFILAGGPRGDPGLHFVRKP